MEISRSHCSHTIESLDSSKVIVINQINHGHLNILIKRQRVQVNPTIPRVRIVLIIDNHQNIIDNFSVINRSGFSGERTQSKRLVRNKRRDVNVNFSAGLTQGKHVIVIVVGNDFAANLAR